MLSQFNLWAEYAGMVMDVILMVRILTLKLRQTYVYLTLYVLLNLFYDVLALKMGIDSDQFQTVSEFSRFIYAIVLPLIAWDLFEEARQTVDKVRKLAMSRMLGSLVFISIWALIMAAFMGDGEGTHYLEILAWVIWIGAVTSAISFLWVMKKATRTHLWELPGNTNVLYWFVLWMLSIEAVSFILVWILLLLKGTLPAKTIDMGQHGLEAVMQVIGIVVTGWCVYKLRAISSDAKDEPVNVKS